MEHGGVLALDLATTTGWALWKPGCEIESGIYKLPKTGDDVGWFLKEHEHRVYNLMCKGYPKIGNVVFEAPILRNTNTKIITLRKLYGLANVVEMLCHWFEVDCSEVHQQSWRKHFLGKGRGDKDEMKELAVEQCRRRGWQPETHDEAEALGVLDYALHCLRETEDIPAGPLFSRVA